MKKFLKHKNEDFVFPIFLAAICHGTTILDDKRISFDRSDNNVAWPLLNPFNTGEQMTHARLCYQEIQETFDATDIWTVMHRQHCRSIIESIVQFFNRNPTFHIDPLICQALTPDKVEENFIMQDRFGRGSGYRMKMIAPISTAGTQKTVYTRLEGRNLGEVLMKNYTSPETLNFAERIYVQQWLQPRSVAVGAVGVYSKVHGDTALVRKILKK